MKQLTFAGHPLHPQLIAGPLGLLPFSFVMDVMYHVTGKQSYADASYYALIGGVGTGLAAGAAGAVDYLTIPSGTSPKRTANTHAILNLGVMSLYGVNIAMRKRNGHAPDGKATLLNGICAAGLLVGAWYGGHLVYHHGMRVKNKIDGLDQPEARPPGDRALERVFTTIEHAMPSIGPKFRSGQRLSETVEHSLEHSSPPPYLPYNQG